MDIDVLKKGMGVMIYYVKLEYIKFMGKDFKKRFLRFVVQFIMYLSWMLTEAEIRYWFIEMEVACIMWTLRKIRYLVEFTVIFIIIFIDYLVTVNIVK